jgi:hypothetical protein
MFKKTCQTLNSAGILQAERNPPRFSLGIEILLSFQAYNPPKERGGHRNRV